MIEVRLLFWWIALALLVTGKASAFVDNPTINPPNPSSSTPISVGVRAGVCHAFIESENPPQLVRHGSQLDFIAEGVASLPEGHPFCVFDTGTVQFPIGTLGAGAYTLRIVILDTSFPDTPVPFGSVSFVVTGEPTVIPTLSKEALLMMMFVFALVGGAMARSRMVGDFFHGGPGRCHTGARNST